jgi:hypothetical protein
MVKVELLRVETRRVMRMAIAGHLNAIGICYVVPQLDEHKQDELWRQRMTPPVHRTSRVRALWGQPNEQNSTTPVVTDGELLSCPW